MKNYMSLLNDKSVSNAKDAFNLERKRSENTEHDVDYNCGGYALETYNWFLPFFSACIFNSAVWRQVCKINGWEYDKDELENGNTEGEQIFADYVREITDLLAEEVLANHELYEIAPDDAEYAYDIAYEIFYEGNFSSRAAINVAVDLMIKHFNLRLIKSFEELKDNEYGIAFATTEPHFFNDFHFIKYVNGIVSHKMGGQPIELLDIKAVNKEIENFFNRLDYNSEVYYFAKQKQ